MRTLSRRALDRMPPLPRWNSLAELEAATDITLATFRRQCQRLGAVGAPWGRAQAWLDRRLRTTRIEHGDDPSYPAVEKLQLVRRLHAFNRLLGSYRRFLSLLRPLVHRAVHRRGHPARVLELCSGSGEFTLELAERARRLGLPLEVTGSDIQPSYVEAAARQARRRRSAARFVVLDALDLGRDGERYDIVFTAQSLHHFSPGQLARIVAGARYVHALAFLGVDGRRCLHVLMGLPLLTSLWLRSAFVHDAVVSGLRLFTEPELALIGRLAAPDASVSVGQRGFSFSVIEVRF